MVSLVSKMSLPVVLGGLVAVGLASLFTPAANAYADVNDTVMQVIEGQDVHLFENTDASSSILTKLEANTWVWVSHCQPAQERDPNTAWCAVEREGVQGWVHSSSLAPYWY